MKRGIGRIIIGIILVILQLMSIAGNAKAGIGIQISFDSLAVFLYDLIFLVSSNCVGIIGIILLVSGVRAYTKGGQEDPAAKKNVIPKEPEELPGFVNPLPEIDGDFKKRNAKIIAVVIVLVLAIAISAFFAFIELYYRFQQNLDPITASESFLIQETMENGETLPKPSIPDNGQTIIPPKSKRDASLSIEALNPGGYYVLLSPIEDSYSNGRMAFFVNYGSPVTITVPSGIYKIYYAAGDNWYGKDYLFGADTEFYMCDGVFLFQSVAYYRMDTLNLERGDFVTNDASRIDEADFPQDFGS